jgi:TolB-like protein/class 3 adenylate cyclase/Flp pilus assembly protein TadD
MQPDRWIATILFTDIVGSTERAAELGDHGWRELRDQHHAIVREELARWGGREVSEAGDGFLSLFDNPAQAILSAATIRDRVRELGLEVRCGVHMGEVEQSADGSLGGITLHIGARVAAQAAAGDILVSSAVRDVEAGSGFGFEDRGRYELKGVPGHWRLFAVTGMPQEVAPPRRLPWITRVPRRVKTGAIALVVVLGLAGFYVVIQDRDGSPKPSGATSVSLASTNRSIAVLPFANMSADAENEYFSDGITDEIITTLSKVGDLKVISRTSIMTYKNTDKQMRQIAEELGVATILEGSVRRTGDRVRITAQLIDAKTDAHLWAESYDRSLTDIFEIQSAVATSIVTALNATLTGTERRWIKQKPTTNNEAYDAYLRANAELTRGGEIGGEFYRRAERFYRQAVELDPNFALAYARLSATHSLMYWYAFDQTPSRLEQVKTAVDRALEIQPDLPEAHLALGYYHYYGHRDYAQAMEEFTRAKRDLPNNADVHAAIGFINRRRGEWDEAVANLERAASLDPRSAHILRNVVQTHVRVTHDFERALEFLDLGLALDPVRFSLAKGGLYVRWKGDTGPLRAALDAIPPDFDPDGMVTRERFKLYWLNRDFDAAIRLLESSSVEAWDTVAAFSTKEEALGDAFFALGDRDRAREHYEAARLITESEVQKRPDVARLRSSLGLVYAGLGRREEAIREGRRAVELLPESKDALIGPSYVIRLAVIYARIGETDLALKELEQLLTMRAGPLRNEVRLDPMWDPLRDDPRFTELVEDDSWLPD